jgi:elongation factor G
MEEDPVLRLSHDPRPTRSCSRGSASSTSRWWWAKLRKRYKVEVILKKPKVPYLETIKAAAEGHGRHKKQTGGHGQFGTARSA